MLAVENLSAVRHYSPLFSNLSFTLKSGNLLLIKGKNGSGKSTLLKILAGLLLPHTGSVTYQCDMPIYYLGHRNGLKLDLTVKENLIIRTVLQDVVLNERTMPSKLTHLQLDSLLNTPVRMLSAGQQRRVALSLLWFIRKQVWLLDEPLTSLDRETERLFTQHLDTHLQQGGIAVICTHQTDMQLSSDYQTLTLDNVVTC